MYLIIDGSSMLSTNYYGTLPREMLFAKTEEEKEKLYPKIMQTTDGKYTNGILLSLRQILSIIKYQKPEGLVVVLDRSRDTFRRELYAEYKAQRSATPSPLKEQFQTFAEILDKMGIPVYSSDRYEADDLAGAIAKQLEAEGKQCALMSADKDYYQLVTPNTSLWRIITYNMQDKYQQTYGVDFTSYAKDNNLPVGVFETKYGDGIFAEGTNVELMPEQFVDYLAVTGDKSDNIPGIDRVGPMTIIPLLKKYGSLKAIYDELHLAQQNNTIKELGSLWKTELGIKISPINAFLKNEANAWLSQKLAQIQTQIDELPQNINVYQLNIDYDGVRKVIQRYELNSLNSLI